MNLALMSIRRICSINYLNKKTSETSTSVNVRDEFEFPLLENEKVETYCFAVFETHTPDSLLDLHRILWDGRGR